MKYLQYIILIVMFVVTSIACASPAPTSGSGMINPGDRIGDFLITTKDSDDVIYVTNLHCPFEDPIETCEKPVGTKINISQGFYPGPDMTTPFEEQWSKQIYQMLIEGRPVNLQAFGYDEWKHSLVGTIRVWNVVIVADRPGTISAESSGVFDGESWKYTAKIIFTKP